jgi:hypothetical protein
MNDEVRDRDSRFSQSSYQRNSSNAKDNLAFGRLRKSKSRTVAAHVLLAPACRNSSSSHVSRSVAEAPLPPVFAFVHASGFGWRFPCASYTLSTSAASSRSWSTSFMHGSHKSSMSFASPLCHKLPMSKLGHAASLFSSDAAPTRKATFKRCPANRKFTNMHHDAFALSCPWAYPIDTQRSSNRPQLR